MEADAPRTSGFGRQPRSDRGKGGIGQQALLADHAAVVDHQPGDVLFDAKRRFTARVRADGSLVTDGSESGSIHSLGAKLQSLPSCNGWTFWYIKRDGKDVPIESFRDEVRAADEGGA